ncbi:MAG: hypothetical protein IJJ70_10125 [Treponema sp.]|nr:hypothetical protein [bacterium]MBQ6056665.1 hypothetical protein [Treponema sp.]MBR0488041.1 hypothetical protein [Treponema sp.]
MSAMAKKLDQMMQVLTDEDYLAAIKYVEFLAEMRKNATKKTIREIQGLFKDDKGWASEEEMLADMAEFRRNRSA